MSSAGLNINGVSAPVPSDYRAHLMYYLSCVNSCLELEDIPGPRMKRFRDYKSFSLNLGELEELTNLCLKFAPYRLKGKCFFVDADMCQGDKCCVYDVNEPKVDKLSVAKNSYISGKARNIHKVFVCTEKWIEENWETPMKSAVSTFK